MLLLIAMISLQVIWINHGWAVKSYVDHDYEYQFEKNTVVRKRNPSVLIDAFHNTIYQGDDHANHDLAIKQIMQEDGMDVGFLYERINNKLLNEIDALLIFGLRSNPSKGLLLLSEVDTLINWVKQGGSLLLVVGHYPNGDGAIGLFDRLGVEYKHGYANFPGLPGEKKNDLCSHFSLSKNNGLIKPHSIVKTSPKNLSVDTVHYLCGGALVRKPEDVVLALPAQTRIYYRDNSSRNLQEGERGNDYAAMLGFNYGAGKVVISSDLGLFRHRVKYFKNKKTPVTMNNPDNQNAALFVNVIRWLTNIGK